ncbi:hypothetical protein KKI24_29760 [bacterium]|nr:hypothetical protein [bacterium]
MEFIGIATEQTTAVTDLVLALVSFIALLEMRLFIKTDRWKSWLWILIFGLLTAAAVLGTIVHGFKMSPSLNLFLWHPLNLALGLMVTFFIVAVVYEIWGDMIARKVLPLMIIVEACFFVVTVTWPDQFIIFIVYEALATIFALSGFLWLAITRKPAGAWFMVSGIFLTIVAAGIQASGPFRLTLIWEFDHNGVFHIIQIAAVYILVWGLRTSLTFHQPPTEESDAVIP